MGLWQIQQEMQEKRWYPSVIYTTWYDGTTVFERMLVPGGRPPGVDDYEALDVGTTIFYRWSNQGTPDRLFPGPSIDWPVKSPLYLYPRLHLLTNGEVYRSGMTPHGVTIRHKDGGVAGTGPRAQWVAKGDGLVQRDYGASFLYPNLDASLTDAVVHLGGRVTVQVSPPIYVYHNTVEISKASASAAGSFDNDPQGWNWKSLPSMAHKRYFPNVVVLPDGSIVVFGGETDVAPGYVFQAELWNGGPNWLGLANSSSPRGQHSSALLLSSGYVLVAGGDLRVSDYDIFVPRNCAASISDPGGRTRRSPSSPTAKPTTRSSTSCPPV